MKRQGGFGLSTAAGFLVTLILLWSMACAPASEAANSSPTSPAEKLTVFAAISLSEAFGEIAAEFERANAGVSVNLNLAGSQRLRTQLEHGARGDVFASADAEQMNLAMDSRLVDGDPVIFATNELVVIVPKGKTPGRVTSVADLGNPRIKLALALPEAPAGRYAREMISKLDIGNSEPNGQLAARIMANVITLEPNVRAAANKVALGEVDAGVVYATDAKAEFIANRVRVIPIPAAANVSAEYPMAVLRDAVEPRLAGEFVRFVLSSKGQAILESHGFGPAAGP